MASSRIFVKGLPPTLTEDEFKKHFSSQNPTTDTKLFPQRRIGYVGYKTPEEATKAIKYFNKTFMRMSRIYVESARPIAHSNPRARSQTDRTLQSHPTPIDKSDANQVSNLKRKRDVLPEATKDPKLQEYLEIMQRPSRSKNLINGKSSEVEVVHDPESIVPGRAEQDGESDMEYQEVRKKTKVKAASPISQIIPSDGMSGIHADHTEAPAVEGTQLDAMQIEPTAQSTSDADWLRTRTNRLLDIESDVEDDHVKLKRTLAGAAETVEDEEDTKTALAATEDPTEDEKPSEEEAIQKSATPEYESGRLFVRNLPYNATEADLEAHFKSYGDVQEVHIPINKTSGEGKGFAYVEYSTSDSAAKAVAELDGNIFQGRLLHILPAKAKKTTKLDEFEISKLPLKKQQQIRRKAEAASSTFNWNSLFMNTNAVMSSVADRLGIDKAELFDPTSSDAAVKQAHAETHVISETKAYFAEHGVDLEAFRKRERGDTAILVKNFPYNTKREELKALFEQHGTVTRFLLPPTGTIAIVQFAHATEARAAFGALSFRKVGDLPLKLEKAPKDLFTGPVPTGTVQQTNGASSNAKDAKLSATDLLHKEEPVEIVNTSTLFVSNLNFVTTTERLTDVFRPLEGFLSATVKTKSHPKDPAQKLSMGFGFLEFRTKQQAQAAATAMNGHDLDGHKLTIRASHKGADAAEERRKEDQAKKAASKSTKIIIRNLPFEISKKDVRSLVGEYGQLRSVRVPKNFDRSARGFAFAEFTTPKEAENAMRDLRNTHFLGRKLVLEYATQDNEDAEEQLQRLEKKAGSQLNKVALQKLQAAGRRKFEVAGDDGEE